MSSSDEGPATGTDIWIVFIEDRDFCEVALPFSSEERAFEVARAGAPDGAVEVEMTPAMRDLGLVLCLHHGLENDFVRVAKRTLDAEPEWLGVRLT